MVTPLQTASSLAVLLLAISAAGPTQAQSVDWRSAGGALFAAADTQAAAATHIRLEPLEGDGLGASFTGRPSAHGTLRVHPDGEARFLLREDDDKVSWFSLTDGAYVDPQRTTPVSIYLRWQVVLVRREGDHIERIILASHDFQPE